NTTGSVAPYPDMTPDPMPENTGPNSDVNLDFSDFLLASSPNQYITVGNDGNGNLKLSFTGEGGADLGSVTLLNVDATAYTNVQSLFDNGIISATGDGFHAGLNTLI